MDERIELSEGIPGAGLVLRCCDRRHSGRHFRCANRSGMNPTPDFLGHLNRGCPLSAKRQDTPMRDKGRWRSDLILIAFILGVIGLAFFARLFLASGAIPSSVDRCFSLQSWHFFSGIFAPLICTNGIIVENITIISNPIILAAQQNAEESLLYMYT